MIRKLLIVPYFGDLPPWFEHWQRNVARLAEHGYDVLLDRDERRFRMRVYARLALDCPPLLAGTGKVWDFRPAFGQIYADKIAGYDFWGHTDLDCVYGRVERWVTDDLLDSLDIQVNGFNYICGCWTLYRNVEAINSLYRRVQGWEDLMRAPSASGWAETSFTTEVDAAHASGEIRRRYDYWQTRDLNNFDTLRLEPDGLLLEGGEEVALAHFRRTKVYPAGCVL